MPYLYINSLPAMKLIHIGGHLCDAFLFVYLINGFFQSKRNTSQTRQTFCLTTLFFAVILYTVDVVTGYSFYPYYTAMILLPLVYSLLCFKGSLSLKILISSIFTALVLSFEQLAMQSLAYSDNLFESNYPLFIVFYFIQRIGIKIIILIIIKKLLLWPKELNIKLPNSCWILLMIVSVSDSLMLSIYQTPRSAEYYLPGIIKSIFLVLIPIFLLLIMKYLSIAAERDRIASAQIAQSKTQSQYLQQQLQMTESLRKFRHDYKSHLFCMDALLTAKEYDKLHDYLVTLHQYQFEGIHLRKFVDDESLNIILNQKVTLAEKCGIEFTTDTVLPETGKISISDLNSLIVNLCDNAIEACAMLPEAKITLAIHKVKAYLVIEITNTCEKDIQAVNPSFITSKTHPEYHGLGIKIIKGIAAKYHGQYQVNYNNHMLSTNLLLLDE